MGPDEPHHDQTASLNEEQLRARVAELEKKLNEIAAHVAYVRHDISNPLTGVLGQAQLLLRGDLPDKVKERVEKIEQLALRVNEIAAKLHEVPRPAKLPMP
jgi:signal transduction histidine kinase